MASCVHDNLEDLAKKTTSNTSSTSTTSSSTVTSSSSSSSSSSASSSSSGSSGSSSSTSGPTTVSFKSDIQPILSRYNCSGCHGSRYYNYPGVYSLAQSGQLYGTMSWSAGYRKMPPTQKPSSAELNLIQTWISEGAQNN